jgi:hypothetical protein
MNAQLGEVALEERGDEVLAPRDALVVVGGEESPGESSSYPALGKAGGRKLLESKALQMNQGHPPRQRLAALPEQLR